MKKKITYNNYRTSARNVQLKIDESFAEKIIPANDSVQLLDQIVEEIDLTPLERALKRGGRKHCTSPVAMLKIILYASMERSYASRPIAQSCLRDMNYIWLLNGEPAPSQRTICRFRSEVLSECGEAIFYALVHRLREMNEIKLEHLFVDGTKLEANANKYSFVWKKSTTKYEARVDKKIETALAELSVRHGVIVQSAEEMLTPLRAKATVPFVYGRGKRKSELQRDIESLDDLVSRKVKYSAYQETFRGRNSFSKTDTDATFMHMKDDHMRNAQLKPGYNIQFAVEGEYITGVDVESERSDQLTLIPLLNRMAHNGLTYSDVTCDAGYESE